MLLSDYGLIKAISNDVKFRKCDGGGYKKTGHVDNPRALMCGLMYGKTTGLSARQFHSPQDCTHFV